jgi:hypothetical protein
LGGRFGRRRLDAASLRERRLITGGYDRMLVVGQPPLPPDAIKRRRLGQLAYLDAGFGTPLRAF